MIQQTSLEAYEKVKNTIGDSQSAVYTALIGLISANNTILARKLGWPINRVTPRVLELRRMGYIIPDFIRPCPITKRRSWFWKVNTQKLKGGKT